MRTLLKTQRSVGRIGHRLAAVSLFLAPSVVAAALLMASAGMVPTRMGGGDDALQVFESATIIEPTPKRPCTPSATPSHVPLQGTVADRWHLDRVNLAGPLALEGNVAEVVAVVDSGVDEDHPALRGRTVRGWNFLNRSQDTRDEWGHGTAVASVVALAQDAWAQRSGQSLQPRIMPLKVSSACGRATAGMLASAIRYAADRGVRVVNVSFGGLHGNRTVQEAIDHLHRLGGVVVLSAGNDGRPLGSQAPVKGLMTVGSTSPSDHRAFFSNTGPALTVVAPGTPILTAQASSDAMNWRQGTSYSAPLVAAAMALLLSSRSDVTIEMAQQAIQDGAVDLGADGFDHEYGHGLLNFSRSVHYLLHGLEP